jgi:hypothetical protein
MEITNKVEDESGKKRNFKDFSKNKNNSNEDSNTNERTQK